MITIIADRHAYQSSPSGALLAIQTADYVPVRRSIRAALDRNEPLTVYVSNPVVLAWLSDLQRYPESYVVWQVVDPGEEFTQLFGVTPTEPFTPKRIAALRLTELPRPPAGTMVHPLSWILGHHLGPVWQHDEPPPGHSARVATWALEHSEPLDDDFTILVQAQLERWSLQQPIFRAFRAAQLMDSSVQLLIRWGLRRYSSVWRETQPWGSCPVLDGEPALQGLIVALRSQQSAIQLYWNRRLARGAVDASTIASALAEMSGLSDVELSALVTIVLRSSEDLDEQSFSLIQRRFSKLPSAEGGLQTLTAHVAPQTPTLPDPDWSPDKMLSWATKHYMPYFAWVIRTNRDRAHQQACAVVYSDWLHKHYPSLLNDDSSPVLIGQYREMDELVDQDSRNVIIWLIIDGMSWWQGALMLEACARQGLHPHRQRPGIAVLPSITSISKRALVTGQPTIDLAEQSIADAVRGKLKRSNIRGVVTYSLPKALAALRQDEELRVAVVLFNLLDVLAHQTAEFTDNPGIRGYLENLAGGLQDAGELCVERGRRLQVLIGSDHGSTLLPQGALALTLPTATREIDDVWESDLPEQEPQKPGTRAAATDIAQMPTVDSEEWYVLDRDSFQLDRHYLVPRKYTYLKRRPSGWTHGGLTPEETIVPLLHLAPERPQLYPLELELHGTLRANQGNRITAHLRNLNSFPLTELTLLVSDTDSEVAISHLDALEQREIELVFDVVQTPGDVLNVTYEVRYNAFGTPQRDEGSAQLAIRRLQTEDTSFDDMFN